MSRVRGSVVIVIVNNGVEPDGAEAMIRRLLESWQPGSSRIGGVAVLGCNVRSGPNVYNLDALVWTPHTCTVVEVKGFRSVQSGVLDPRDNGSWHVDGMAADLYSLGSVANPVAQAKRYMYAVKNQFSPKGLPDWVHLLVVLAPLREAHLTITSAQLHPGTFVVAASPDDDRALREYFSAGTGAKPRWSGEDLERAFTALGLDDYVPDRRRLAEEGFPYRRLPVNTPTHTGDRTDPSAHHLDPTPPRLPISPAAPAPRNAPAPSFDSSTNPSELVEEHTNARNRRPHTEGGPRYADHAGQFSTAPAFDEPRRQRPPVSDQYPAQPAAPPAFAGPAARRWSQWPGTDTAASISAISILAVLLILVARCGAERATTRTDEPVAPAPPAAHIHTSPPPMPSTPPAYTPNSCMPFQKRC